MVMYKVWYYGAHRVPGLARLAHLLDQVSHGRYRLSTHLLPTLHTGHWRNLLISRALRIFSLVGTDSRYVTA